MQKDKSFNPQKYESIQLNNTRKYATCRIHVIHVHTLIHVYDLHMYYICRTTCVIQVYILYMYYICRNTCVIQVCILYIYYICRTTCVIQVCILYMYYICRNTCVANTYLCVIHIFCTCNTPNHTHPCITCVTQLAITLINKISKFWNRPFIQKLKHKNSLVHLLLWKHLLTP